MTIDLDPASVANERFDVIVVGSGTAGSVIVRRLIDHGASVLLLEAGGPDENPAIHIPSRVFELWDAEEDWGYRTVPQAGCHGREVHLPRGRVRGGSSSLNGMVYIRGHPSDFDAWAYEGNHGWSYDDVLPLFKRSEDFDGGESRFHGAGGELHVRADYERHPFHASYIEAAQQAGVPFNPDHNGAELDGVGWAQLTIKDGRRQSQAVAFLDPIRGAPNLTVLTRARAHKLLIERDRCVGVEIGRDGRREQIRAEHEVIVCAGTIESPKLLMLSGVGDGQELRRFGIGVVVDLPGVGENLHDHVLAPLTYSSARAMPPVVEGLWHLNSQLFARSRSGLLGPDLQPLTLQLPLYPEGETGPEEGYSLMVGIVRPASRGTLALRSTDPGESPAIDPGYLLQNIDVEAFAYGLDLCREIGEASALDEWRGEELHPGRHVRSRKQVRDYVRQTCVTYHHQVGTCKMGVDKLAVVDPELLVYGIDGLRVADASIMPTVPSGNTNAAVTMIGERAADLIVAALGSSG